MLEDLATIVDAVYLLIRKSVVDEAIQIMNQNHSCVLSRGLESSLKRSSFASGRHDGNCFCCLQELFEDGSERESLFHVRMANLSGTFSSL